MRREASFSVVIPAFNAGRFIGSAIKSVLDQSVSAEQVLVVDDGSTDDTGDIVTAFDDPRVELLRKDSNSGVSAARNMATEKARGLYIAYLDADDSWDTDKLRLFAEAAACSDYPALIFSDFHRVELESGKRLARNSELNPFVSNMESTRMDCEGDSLLLYSQLDGLRLLSAGYPMYPSAFAVRKDALRAVGGWNEKWVRSEDFELCLRVFRKYPVAYLPRDLTTVGRHEGHGELAQYILKHSRWDVASLRAHWKDTEGDPASHQVLEAGFAKRLSGLGWHLRRARQWSEARQSYRELMGIRGYRGKGLFYWLASWAEQLLSR